MNKIDHAQMQRDFATLPDLVNGAMTTARKIVEDHIAAYGMVPHPDKIKDAIAAEIGLTQLRTISRFRPQGPDPLDQLRQVREMLVDLEGEIDRQTYDEKRRAEFDAPDDAEYDVTLTAKADRSFSRALTLMDAALRLMSEARSHHG